MGFASSPSARLANSATRARQAFGWRAAEAKASSASMKKRPERTSLRAETQATDSTCKGWTAKTAAAKALRGSSPASLESATNSRALASAWSSRFVSRKPPGVEPVQLEVEHPGEAGEREPVRPLLRREGPADALPADPLLDLGVAGDVDVVVVIQPLVLADREVDRAGEGEDQRAEHRPSQGPSPPALLRSRG